MTSIHVVFPKTGDPIVVHENEAVLEGNDVFWHVRSDNPKVESVKIEFQTDFFPNKPTDRHFYVQALQSLGGRRHGKVYGTAPAAATLKYTVKGLDSGGATVTKLDPKIVVAKP